MPPSISPQTLISSIDDDFHVEEDFHVENSSEHKPEQTRSVTSLKNASDVTEELCWPDRPSTPIPWAGASSVCPERSCDIWCCHTWQSASSASTSQPASTAQSANCDQSLYQSSWSSYSGDVTNTAAATTTSTTTTTSTLTPSSYSICGTGTSTSSVYLQDSISEKHYSCGQSSLFGELQSVVFNSLIASLET